MNSIQVLAAACVLLTAVAASAQSSPAAGGAKPAPMPAHAASMPGGSAADRMAMMDKHMQSMREMHDKMARARTPEERQALMADARAPGGDGAPPAFTPRARVGAGRALVDG